MVKEGGDGFTPGILNLWAEDSWETEELETGFFNRHM